MLASSLGKRPGCMSYLQHKNWTLCYFSSLTDLGLITLMLKLDSDQIFLDNHSYWATPLIVPLIGSWLGLRGCFLSSQLIFSFLNCSWLRLQLACCVYLPTFLQFEFLLNLCVESTHVQFVLHLQVLMYWWNSFCASVFNLLLYTCHMVVIFFLYTKMLQLFPVGDRIDLLVIFHLANLIPWIMSIGFTFLVCNDGILFVLLCSTFFFTLAIWSSFSFCTSRCWNSF